MGNIPRTEEELITTIGLNAIIWFIFAIIGALSIILINNIPISNLILYCGVLYYLIMGIMILIYTFTYLLFAEDIR